jgi:3-oxoacyl-[acyl-carrier protein] reductase
MPVRVALVTGAGHGMGAAHVRGLVQAGFQVAAADTDADSVRALATDLAGVLPLEADVADEPQVQEMVDTVLKTCGSIDVLVNNAGGGITTSPLVETSLAAFEATLRLNLTSQFLCCRAVLPAMMTRREGRIINIASASFFNGATAALYRDPPANFVAYVASKGGVVGLTRALAREVGAWNITVNAVAPGLTMTGVIPSVYPAAAIDRVVHQQALARPQQPDDATGAVVFLASPGAAFMTGQVLHVDGGWTLT